jgi:hypothetical protein
LQVHDRMIGSRMLPFIPPAGFGRRAHFASFAIACLTLAPVVVGAQRSAPATPAASCAPRQTGSGPAFVRGNQGGTLRPHAVRLWADGSVRTGAHARTTANQAIADSVRAIATDVRHSALWGTIAPPITRPTRNPDVAREYIEVSLTCGHRRWLYPADETPAAFDALSRRLDALARLAGAP